ncbi:MAG: SDR family NAD(P)-dependent oxidoreductase [Pseudomonadota bacterium]
MDNGKKLLITGASAGIGAELAKLYASEGHTLYLTGRNAERLEAVAGECRAAGAIVETATFDVVDREKAEEWYNGANAGRPVDCLILNAGVMRESEDLGVFESAADIELQIAVNLTSCLTLSTFAAQKMAENNHGHIVFISSIAAIQPLSRAATYSASKAALISYGEALSGHCAVHGVSVSVICPGFVDTDMAAQLKTFKPFQLTSEDAARRIRRAITDKKPFYGFPAPLLWLARTSMSLPPFLRRPLVKMFE